MSAESLLLQNGLIEVGVDGQPMQPQLALSSRGGHKIGIIQNVCAIEQTHPLSDVAELSFDVYKETNGVVCSLWDEIKDFKFVQNVHDNMWYEAHVSLDEENDIIKHVTCTHANETELGQLNLYDVEINTEADISRDDYVETYFYNEENEKASLLNRILHDKAPHYSIKHVDSTLRGLFRTFSFNGISIHDALNQIAEEVHCLFVYGESDEDDGKYHRTISAYDLEDYCYHCGKRGQYTEHVCTNCGSTNIHYGYGNDTGIYVAKENLAKSISYEGNADEVKNCFHLVAGDDVMTAAVKACNPSMSQYIWHFSDEFLDDMSNPLKTKIVAYQALVDQYKNTRDLGIAQLYITRYNNLVSKYSAYNEDLVAIDYPIIGTTKLIDAYYNAVNLYGWIKSELMPQSEDVETTTAAKQMAILKNNGNMSQVGIPTVSGTIPYTTANTAIQSYAKVYIDTSRYRVAVSTNSIANKIWNGTITISSYIDEEDIATSSFTITLFDSTDSTKYEEWVEQSVQKAMANREATNIGVIELFKTDETLADFKERIKLYSLDYLDIMANMASSAIAVMSEQGISRSSNVNTDVYIDVYTPYLNKSKAIQTEIRTKEVELSYLLRPTDDDGNIDSRYPDLGLIDVIENKQIEIRNALDIHTYLGDELWDELSFYRREDEYSNSNYISDGLSDSEIIQQAQRFIDAAENEIQKASTLQHTISAPLINFLLMEEFARLQENFKVGNWIRLKVDGVVYKLRLANWTIDYDSIEDLDVEFTDAIKVGGIIDDVASILSKSRSMSTSYDYTAKQANKGKDASDILKSYKNLGIDFSKVKAIKSRGTTDIIYDDDGILLRRIDGDDVLPEQARLFNNGIYITGDAWETVRSGLGYFSYVDPETQETINTYGVIADTVIGKLILGNELKIYTPSGNFQIDENGLTASNGTASININPSATNPFVISKGTTNVLTVNSSGNLTVKGAIVADTLSAGGKTSATHNHAGLFIDSSGNLTAGNSGQVKINAAGTFSIGSGNNYISYNSNGLSVKGAINATSLSTGSKTSSTANANGIYIDSSGNLYAGSANQVKINADGTFTMGSGTHYISYNSSGSLSIKGLINATGGSIGGFNIGDNKLYSGDYIELSKTKLYLSGTSDKAKYAFYAFASTSKFYGCIRGATTGLYWGFLPSDLDYISDDIHKSGWGIYAQSDMNVQSSNALYLDSADQIDFDTSQSHIVISGTSDCLYPYDNNSADLGSGSHIWKDIYAYNYRIKIGSTDRPVITTGTVNNAANWVIFGEGTGTVASTGTVLRGKTVRIYAHGNAAAVYLGSTGSTAITSDENLKDLYTIDDRYEDFFNELNPCVYKYKIGHRSHLGFGAQSVERAILNAGLTTEEFAGVLIDYDVNIPEDERLDVEGNTHFDVLYSLRYEEFIALNTYMIKKLQNRITELENVVKQLTT